MKPQEEINEANSHLLALCDIREWPFIDSTFPCSKCLKTFIEQAALAESGAEFASQQRVAEERGRKLGTVENRAAMLEAEVAQLRGDLEESAHR